MRAYLLEHRRIQPGASKTLCLRATRELVEVELPLRQESDNVNRVVDTPMQPEFYRTRGQVRTESIRRSAGRGARTHRILHRRRPYRASHREGCDVPGGAYGTAFLPSDGHEKGVGSDELAFAYGIGGSRVALAARRFSGLLETDSAMQTAERNMAATG